MSTDRRPAASSGRPGRYSRSFGGLVGSLVVCVVVIVGVLGYRHLFSRDLDVEPENVDYLETVRLAQDAGLRVAYPEALPDGWQATGVDVVPGDDATFEINLLTDDDKFVGVREQVGASPGALLDTYVDDDPVEADGLTVDSPVAKQWDGWSDAGGDSAYSTEFDGAGGASTAVIVFGSAPTDQVADLVEALTLDRVAKDQVTSTPSSG